MTTKILDIISMSIWLVIGFLNSNNILWACIIVLIIQHLRIWYLQYKNNYMTTISPGAKDFLIKELNTDPFIANAFDEESMWQIEITEEIKKELYEYFNARHYQKLQKLLIDLGVKRNIKKFNN